jgi:hypothetical protein
VGEGQVEVGVAGALLAVPGVAFVETGSGDDDGAGSGGQVAAVAVISDLAALDPDEFVVTHAAEGQAGAGGVIDVAAAEVIDGEVHGGSMIFGYSVVKPMRWNWLEKRNYWSGIGKSDRKSRIGAIGSEVGAARIDYGELRRRFFATKNTEIAKRTKTRERLGFFGGRLCGLREVRGFIGGW